MNLLTNDGRCQECYRGFCDTCLGNSCSCSHNIVRYQPTFIEDDPLSEETDRNSETRTDSSKRFRRLKPDDELRDPYSTFRKREERGVTRSSDPIPEVNLDLEG